MDKTDIMITELRMRMGDVARLPEELDFFDDITTLTRFLKARDWNLDEAEKLLKSTIEWRRKTRPLQVDCKWCHEKPGYHSVRQIGFDEMGRPVIYANFCQASTHKYTVEDSVAHVTYLIENAKRTMPQGIHQWVFVMDCTGMTLSACNPKLGYGLTSIMSNYYPERLGLVICLNHNRIFQGVWNTFKKFLHANTVAKMQLVRSKKKIKDLFDRHFDQELVEWLNEEIRLNKLNSKLPREQREFWSKPEDATSHDPRGTASYIQKYIDNREESEINEHKPHPNILDIIEGKKVSLTDDGLDPERLKALDELDKDEAASDSSDSFDLIDDIVVSEDQMVPKDAQKF